MEAKRTKSPVGYRARLEDPTVPTRAEALVALLDDVAGARRVVPDVARRIDDADIGLRRLAVRVLTLAGAEGVPALIRALSPRQPAAVRVQSAGALAEIGPDAVPAVEPLVACLSAPVPLLRQQSSRALGRIGEASVSPLRANLSATDDPLVLAATCDALGYVGPPAEPAIPDLEPPLATEDPTLRLAALSAVSRIREEPEERLEEIVGMTIHPDAAVRRDAVARIGEQGPKGQPASGRVFALLADSHPAVRAEAAYVLVRIEADPAVCVEPLVARLRDPDAGVRVAAAAALRGFEPPSAVPALRARLADPDPAVVVAAQSALEKIGGADNRFENGGTASAPPPGGEPWGNR